MAKTPRKVITPDDKKALPDNAAVGLTTPVPHSPLLVTEVKLAPGQVLHRVHDEKYLAAQFNPSTIGNARFSPIKDATGAPIPTLYAGTTKDCALMETIFHDVPFVPGFKTLDKNKLNGQVHSTVVVTQDLNLIDLSSIPLRKLGITRAQLIDTEKDQYPATRLWAEAFHQQCPKAQGLFWVLRQDDSARAMVLFEDRIPAGVLQQVGISLSLSSDSATYADVLDLAARLGVQIVPGLG